MSNWTVFPFDYKAVAVSWKVDRSLTGLTTPGVWLLLLPLTVLSRSFWRRFCVVKLLFDFSVSVGAFVIGLSQISSFFSLSFPLIFVKILKCLKLLSF